MKKHQINLITALTNEYGQRPFVTKSFKNGKPASFYFPKYWKQRIVGWDNLRDLANILTPYIEGEAPEWEYTALSYGQFIPELKEELGYRRLKANMEDTGHQYFILDIETDAPEYEDVCLDLNKVRSWLIDTYDWIHNDTGMFLHFSASAGVIREDGTDKHKQIRVRAIMEHTCVNPLGEDERKHYLRPYMKLTGQGKDFTRHIDNCSHQMSRIFFLAPPFIDNTKRVLCSDTTLLVEGKSIQFDDLRHFDKPLQTPSVEGQSSSINNKNTPSTLNLRQEIKERETQEWFDDIEDGNRYEGHYNLLWSAYVHKELDEWRSKLLRDRFKLGDKTPKQIDSVIEYIKENHSIDFNIPFEYESHNVTDIEEYRLSKWHGEIEWKDKGVILQKLFEGTGKTEALQDLRKQYPNKSLLYLAPSISAVETACKDLGLTNYTGMTSELATLDDEGNPKHKLLGACYPSLHWLEIKDDQNKGTGNWHPINWDIVVMDEIEQLLVFATNEGYTDKGIINDPELNNTLLRMLVEKAELVVGLDARISNLTLGCLESWRIERPFDIYTQSKVKPFSDHRFCFTNTLASATAEIIEAVKVGKRVAVVSELDNKKTRAVTLQAMCDYVEQETDLEGMSIDAGDKTKPLHRRILTELSKEGKRGKLEELLLENKISHIWMSPVVQSSWSYISNEAPFDLVVGLYPNRVLTAPNIIQHIKRFRTSKNFLLVVDQKDFKTNPKKIYDKLFPKQRKEGVAIDTAEFNGRKRLNEHFKELQLNNRNDHLKEIIRERGGEIIEKGDVAEDKDLQRFIKERFEEIKKLMRSSPMWARLQEMEEHPERSHVYDELQLIRAKFKPTLDEIALLLLADLKPQYDNITTSHTSLDDETLNHYFLADKNSTQYHREFFNTDDRERMDDYENPTHANKLFKLEKGIHLDACCKLLGILKDEEFHRQIKPVEIYEQEVKTSDWYYKILQHRALIPKLFHSLKVPKDFEDNPIPFLKTFTTKVFGISCEVHSDIWTKEEIPHRDKVKAELIKEHKSRDLYRHHFKLKTTPRAPRTKLTYSKKYIEENKELTSTERTFKRVFYKHLKIQRNQPQWNPYLPKNISNGVEYKNIEQNTKIFKQNRGVAE